jgi:hypothetical protein
VPPLRMGYWFIYLHIGEIFFVNCNTHVASPYLSPNQFYFCRTVRKASTAITNGSSANQSLSSQPGEFPFSKSTIVFLPPSLLPSAIWSRGA